jgi:hypothetical protein
MQSAFSECIVCDSLKNYSRHFDESVLTICSECGFSSRVYSSHDRKLFDIVRKEQVVYTPSSFPEPLRQNKGYTFGGVSDSWAPMESWGRRLGAANRATITFHFNSPLKYDTTLKLVLTMPSKTAQSSVSITIEDRECLATRLSGSLEYYFELDVPYAWVAEKKKVDLNIYSEDVMGNTNTNTCYIGVAKLCIYDCEDATTTIQFLNDSRNVIPFVKGQVEFCQEAGGGLFKSSLAEVVASNLSHYPPEQFGIWLRNIVSVLRISCMDTSKVLNLKLVSPVLGKKCRITVNNDSESMCVFDDKFINVEIDLSQIADRTILKIVIDSTSVTDMKSLGNKDVREISIGLASIEVK